MGNHSGTQGSQVGISSPYLDVLQGIFDLFTSDLLEPCILSLSSSSVTCRSKFLEYIRRSIETNSKTSIYFNIGSCSDLELLQVYTLTTKYKDREIVEGLRFVFPDNYKVILTICRFRLSESCSSMSSMYLVLCAQLCRAEYDDVMFDLISIHSTRDEKTRMSILSCCNNLMMVMCFSLERGRLERYMCAIASLVYETDDVVDRIYELGISSIKCILSIPSTRAISSSILSHNYTQDRYSKIQEIERHIHASI